MRINKMGRKGFKGGFIQFIFALLLIVLGLAVAGAIVAGVIAAGGAVLLTAGVGWATYFGIKKYKEKRIVWEEQERIQQQEQLLLEDKQKEQDLLKTDPIGSQRVIDLSKELLAEVELKTQQRQLRQSTELMETLRMIPSRASTLNSKFCALKSKIEDIRMSQLNIKGESDSRALERMREHIEDSEAIERDLTQLELYLESVSSLVRGHSNQLPESPFQETIEIN